MDRGFWDKYPHSMNWSGLEAACREVEGLMQGLCDTWYICRACAAGAYATAVRAGRGLHRACSPCRAALTAGRLVAGEPCSMGRSPAASAGGPVARAAGCALPVAAVICAENKLPRSAFLHCTVISPAVFVDNCARTTPLAFKVV